MTITAGVGDEFVSRILLIDGKPKRMNSEAAYLPNALARTAEVREGSAEIKPLQLSKAPEMVAGEGPIPDASDELLLGQVREGAKEALGILFRRQPPPFGMLPTGSFATRPRPTMSFRRSSCSSSSLSSGGYPRGGT